jgi:S1-C subfamily serine protease
MRTNFRTARAFLTIAILAIGLTPSAAHPDSVLEMSRASTVKVVSQTGKSSATGFFLDKKHVLTCFHAVASLSVKDSTVNWSLFPDLQVVFQGERINVTVSSVPTPADPSPLMHDFAILELQAEPAKDSSPVELASVEEKSNVGDEVVFSGFPLATPGMVTHRGMVSGFDDTGSLIFVQGPINKGNSGGALLNSKGHVIGIVSMREGGISQGLNELTVYIDQTSSHGSVTIMGVDPLQTTKAIIQTLDRYISTGIGYARSISFAREYIRGGEATPK